MSKTIQRLNHKGEGIAEASQPVPRVLPGEIIDEYGRILTPSSNRVKPPCRHYKSCGGCSLQHASDDFVAHWKTQVIQDGLAAHGLKTEIRPIVTSPPKSRRKATLHGRRTKSGAMVGFFAAASETLSAVPECQVLHPSLTSGFAALQALTCFAGSRKGIVHFDVTLTDNGLDVNVRDGKPVGASEIEQAANLAREFGLARLSWDGDTIVNRLPAFQLFEAAKVIPPPGAFLQATKHGEAALLTCVREAIADKKRVIELFAGCGTFTLPIAKKCEVWALEGDQALVEALDDGWRQTPGLKTVRSEVRDLFRRPLLAQEFNGFDAVVLDPPRAGALAQTTELVKSDVQRIAAISCNPVTFARDAAIFKDAGYTLDWVQPVDQFRWSSHIELAAQFTKAHMPAK